MKFVTPKRVTSYARGVARFGVHLELALAILPSRCPPSRRNKRQKAVCIMLSTALGASVTSPLVCRTDAHRGSFRLACAEHWGARHSGLPNSESGCGAARSRSASAPKVITSTTHSAQQPRGRKVPDRSGHCRCSAQSMRPELRRPASFATMDEWTGDKAPLFGVTKDGHAKQPPYVPDRAALVSFG